MFWEDLGGPEKGLFSVNSHHKDLIKANLIWADSAGWTGQQERTPALMVLMMTSVVEFL